ncbi:MAG: hypothetical protein LBR08_03665 [Bacteroidales bacterium]|nr:hypothetical protein [Bacteroidales bacterium]
MKNPDRGCLLITPYKTCRRHGAVRGDANTSVFPKPRMGFPSTDAQLQGNSYGVFRLAFVFRTPYPALRHAAGMSGTGLSRGNSYGVFRLAFVFRTSNSALRHAAGMSGTG